MGLTIRNYIGVKKLDALYDDEEERAFDSVTNEEIKIDFVQVFVHSAFPGSADDLVPDAIYSYEQVNIIFDSTCSDYGSFRRMLAHAVFNLSDDKSAFIEMICFSDCEGTLGTQVCKKLATDFVKHEKVFESLFTNADFFSKYKKLSHGFVLAAQNGFVRYS